MNPGEEEVIAIRCKACGKLHVKEDHPDKDTYITFHGNVTIGERGGVIGPCDSLGPQRYCRSLKCLGSISHFIGDLIGTQPRLKGFNQSINFPSGNGLSD